jgi:hypothetical protein
METASCFMGLWLTNPSEKGDECFASSLTAALKEFGDMLLASLWLLLPWMLFCALSEPLDRALPKGLESLELPWAAIALLRSSKTLSVVVTVTPINRTSLINKSTANSNPGTGEEPSVKRTILDISDRQFFMRSRMVWFTQ